MKVNWQVFPFLIRTAAHLSKKWYENSFTSIWQLDFETSLEFAVWLFLKSLIHISSWPEETIEPDCKRFYWALNFNSEHNLMLKSSNDKGHERVRSRYLLMLMSMRLHNFVLYVTWTCALKHKLECLQTCDLFIYVFIHSQKDHFSLTLKIGWIFS